MRRAATLAILLGACRPAKPPQAAVVDSVPTIAPTAAVAALPSDAAAGGIGVVWPLPAVVVEACDSAYALARRALPGAMIARQDSAPQPNDIEGAGSLGCGVTIHGANADGSNGAPYGLFEHGVGGAGWDMSGGRFAADGVDGTAYAVAKPEVLCAVSASWYDPGDYAEGETPPPPPPSADSFEISAVCVPDRGAPPPPPEVPFFQFERSYSLNVNHGHPCTHLSKYTIVATPLGDGQNYDLIIRPFPEGHCDIDSLAGDLVIRHVTAGEVSGVIGDAFVTDVRPAADGRVLRIIDLPTQRVLFEGRYLEINDRAPPGKIGLWQRVSLPARKPWCPPPVPGAPENSVDSLRYVDLSTGQVSPAGWESCPVHPRRR